MNDPKSPNASSTLVDVRAFDNKSNLKLINSYGENRWSHEQEHTHKRIKSLHDNGKGYRTIAKLLNVKNLKTAKGKEWKNTNVYSVLKRYAERQARLERQSYTSEMKLSKMKLEWLKD